MSGKIYAVKVGRIPGLYTTWPQASSQVTGFSGAVFKSFSTKLEAMAYLYDGNIPPEEEALAKESFIARTAREKKGLPPIIPTRPENPESNNSATKTDEIKSKYYSHTYGDMSLPVVQCAKNEYVRIDRKILNTPDDFTVIYIDGSKRPSVNHRGSGAYCRFKDQDFSMSVPCTQQVLDRYQITAEEFAKMSSPSMEYLALSEVLFRFLYYNPSEKNLVPRHLAFVGDYNGVKYFTDGSWTAKESYIIKIRNIVWTIIDILLAKSVTVSIHHVNGHRGILGNELSDVLAKSTVPFDSIIHLVSKMSSDC